jgi:hypothetical protein
MHVSLQTGSMHTQALASKQNTAKMWSQVNIERTYNCHLFLLELVHQLGVDCRLDVGDEVAALLQVLQLFAHIWRPNLQCKTNASNHGACTNCFASFASMAN